MVLTEDVKNELKLRFGAIFETEKKIQTLIEQEKVYKDSIKDTFEQIAETMGIDIKKDKEGKKAIQDGYKEYLKSIEFPSAQETKDEIFAILKSEDILGLEKLKD